MPAGVVASLSGLGSQPTADHDRAKKGESLTVHTVFLQRKRVEGPNSFFSLSVSKKPVEKIWIKT
jgi:hypothetical protein